jgi:hypothetical protein
MTLQFLKFRLFPNYLPNRMSLKFRLFPNYLPNRMILKFLMNH